MNKYEKERPTKTVLLIGGTGFFEIDGGRNLHHDIEHFRPLYSLYKDYVDCKISEGRKKSYFDDYLNYSIGFTSRGCFRKCHFCVNRKYDHAFVNSPLDEFLDKDRPMIYLWDDNIFALKDGWEKIFDDLNATGKPFQFRQGLDIRLLQEGHAKKLCNSKYHGDFIFAFDHVNEAKLIERKLQLWRKWCSKTTKLYVLCAFDSWDYEVVATDLQDNYHHYFLKRMNGFNSQEERDQVDIEGVFERIQILMKYGCLPYIMRFEKYKESRYRGVYTELARWCNQPNFFKKKSFRQFCEANRDYNNNEMCASYQAMLLFERDRPDIAKKYFDMRFDQINECVVSYGRKMTHPCDVCKNKGKYLTWDDFFNDNTDKITFIRQYFEGSLDFSCFIVKPRHCCMIKTPINALAYKVLHTLHETPIETILDIIDNIPDSDLVPEDIPQISKLKYAADGLVHLSKSGLTYVVFGSLLEGRKTDTEVSKQKYGENHAKILAMLDLAWIDKKEKPNTVKISPIGECLRNCNYNDIVPKLILRTPVIQSLMKKSKLNPIDIRNDLTMLKTSTAVRRTTSIKALLKELKKLNSNEIDKRLNNIMPEIE